VQYAAFKLAISLSSVTFGKSLTSLAAEGFLNCHSLASVSLPEPLGHIGRLCFQNCTSLREVVLPNGLEDLGESAFATSGLVRLAIAGGIANINASALLSANSLSVVTLFVVDNPGFVDGSKICGGLVAFKCREPTIGPATFSPN
jgi:hypothetical protein